MFTCSSGSHEGKGINKQVKSNFKTACKAMFNACGIQLFYFSNLIAQKTTAPCLVQCFVSILFSLSIAGKKDKLALPIVVLCRTATLILHWQANSQAQKAYSLSEG